MDLEGLVGWARRALGHEVTDARRLTVGNARMTVRITTAETPPRNVILRHETGGGPLSGTVFSLEREADVCRAVQGRGLPTPGVLAEDRTAAVLATECLSGDHDFRGEALDDYLRCLRALHDLNPASLDLPGFTSSIAGELTVWRAILADKAPGRSAVADHAFAELLRLRPAEPARTVLCHGDPGPGNYLRHGDKVTAMLDWEMAHLGDPMDDLAWITVRAALYGLDLGDFGAQVARAYGVVGLGGRDVQRQRFWQAFGFLRMLVICLSAAAEPRSGKERLLQMTLIPALEYHVLEGLAQLEGQTLGDVLASARLEPAAFPVDLLREAARDLNEVMLPKLATDEALTAWTKRIRNLLTQIAAAPAPATRAASGSREALAPEVVERLRWLPAAREQAERRPASFLPAETVHAA